MEVVESIVKKIIYEISGESVTKTNMRLKEDCALDSLSVVSLIVQLEEAFNIRFEDSDLEPSALETMENIIELVQKHLVERK